MPVWGSRRLLMASQSRHDECAWALVLSGVGSRCDDRLVSRAIKGAHGKAEIEWFRGYINCSHAPIAELKLRGKNKWEQDRLPGMDDKIKVRRRYARKSGSGLPCQIYCPDCHNGGYTHGKRNCANLYCTI